MRKRSIALVAHDNKKEELLAWTQKHIEVLKDYDLYATGTTGRMLSDGIKTDKELSFHKVQSGPLGGDQQIGAKIVEGKIDYLIFFWDPLEPQPHDPDVKALLRIAVTWDIPFACNKASANFLFASPEFNRDYQYEQPDFTEYKNRQIKSKKGS